MPEKKPLILFVDDEVGMLEIFSTALTEAGFKVVEARGGMDALKKLETIRPDLILLDLQMPDIDGMEVLSRIKATPELKDIKVVFLTNFGEPREAEGWIDEKVTREIGALDYIKKTDDLDKIIEEVRSLLEK